MNIEDAKKAVEIQTEISQIKTFLELEGDNEVKTYINGVIDRDRERGKSQRILHLIPDAALFKWLNAYLKEREADRDVCLGVD